MNCIPSFVERFHLPKMTDKETLTLGQENFKTFSIQSNNPYSLVQKILHCGMGDFEEGSKFGNLFHIGLVWSSTNLFRASFSLTRYKIFSSKTTFSGLQLRGE